jgi:hypothetical protein
VVVEAVGVGQLLEQGAAFVKSDLDWAAVADAGPGLGFLRMGLDSCGRARLRRSQGACCQSWIRPLNSTAPSK